MTAIVTINASVQPPTSADQFAVCRHDFDLRGVSRPTHNRAPRRIHGLPETVMVFDTGGYIQLTQELQWDWFNLLCSLDGGHDLNYYQDKFKSLTASDRAWTNRYGSDVCAVYPSKSNLDKEDMRLFPLLSGGAVIKIIGDPTAQTLQYETLSTKDRLSDYSPITHPHLFFYPTNSVRTEIWWDKQTHEIVPEGTPGSIWSESWVENKVLPFPQFNGLSIVPIITRGARVQFIDKSKVRLLPLGSQFPSPFVY